MARKTQTVAEYLKAQIDISDKTQREIAAEAGFANQNMITMLKLGTTKLPLERAPALARALGIDPAHLFRLVMQEYSPELWSIVNSIFDAPVLTENEKSIINFIREQNQNNPALNSDAERQALANLVCGKTM